MHQYRQIERPAAGKSRRGNRKQEGHAKRRLAGCDAPEHSRCIIKCPLGLIWDPGWDVKLGLASAR